MAIVIIRTFCETILKQKRNLFLSSSFIEKQNMCAPVFSFVTKKSKTAALRTLKLTINMLFVVLTVLQSSSKSDIQRKYKAIPVLKHFISCVFWHFSQFSIKSAAGWTNNGLSFSARFCPQCVISLHATMWTWHSTECVEFWKRKLSAWYWQSTLMQLWHERH